MRPYKKKTLWPLFMDGVQSHQGYRATTRRQFTFYHSIPRNSWHSFNRPWIDERLSQSWSYPVVVLNMGPLDWPLLLDTYYWHLLSGKMKWWKWKKDKKHQLIVDHFSLSFQGSTQWVTIHDSLWGFEISWQNLLLSWAFSWQEKMIKINGIINGSVTFK